MSVPYNQQEHCQHKNQSNGYGLAGGGMGAYTYCDDCGKVLWKEQDPDEDDTDNVTDRGEG